MDEPQKDYSFSIKAVLLATATGVTFEFLPKLLMYFFPRAGRGVGLAIFWALVVLLVVFLVRGIYKRASPPHER